MDAASQQNQTGVAGTIYILQTGGSIDKDYPRKACGYSFEICEPAARKILTRAYVSHVSGGSQQESSGVARPPFVIEEVLRKDSLDMTDADRERIFEKCLEICLSERRSTRIVITHGTDTMIQTGKYLADRITNMRQPLIIALTGSLLPERFKETDADFNLGVAVGAVQCLTRPGVYIAVGQVIPVEYAARVIATGKFINLLTSEIPPDV